jgi:hypothetical protein
MKLAFVLVALLAVVVFVAVAHRRGWINLRASGSGVTAGLAQAGQFVDPPTKHVVEVKQAKPPADTPGDPPTV